MTKNQKVKASEAFTTCLANNAMNRILGQQFFNRDTKVIAKEMIGKFLVRRLKGRIISAMITETEAYDGFKDLASHARKGKTKRTEIMFGPPGHFYIYLCYGMYYMLNISTREALFPAAVLIRGITGMEGPGKLCKFLKIDKKLNGLIANKKSGLWFEDRGIKIKKSKVKKTARVGVSYAGPIWSAKKLRFILGN